MVQKIHAAVSARHSPDFLLIARTDARAVEGLDATLERARRYREAGADVLFIEAPQTDDEIRAIAQAFPDVPLLFNWAEGGKTPPIRYSELKALGYRIVIFPISMLLAATRAMQTVLARIRADGTPAEVLADLPRFGEFLDFIGLPEIQALEQRFS
jgi:2-methylisocitrate lyase-like PEP mutase family enzyme